MCTIPTNRGLKNDCISKIQLSTTDLTLLKRLPIITGSVRPILYGLPLVWLDDRHWVGGVDIRTEFVVNTLEIRTLL